MKSIHSRFLEEIICEDLMDKMVFLGGPRQVGKTTLSRDIIAKNHFSSYSYLSWDSKSDRERILNEKLVDAELIIFDEIHKYSKWKTAVKGFFDKRIRNQKIIVAGSAKLSAFRRGGDSLQGRYHYFCLHPFSLSELHEHAPSLTPFEALNFSENLAKDSVNHLLKFGGFPEPLLKKSDRLLRRWHKERVERLCREDVRDLTSIRELSSMQLLVDMLPDRVGSILSINAIREDLEVSHKSAATWLDVLESLCYSYRIYPYQNNKIRSIKKDAKLYLWDWSEVKDKGAQFENFIAGHLLKTVHYLANYEGYNANLYYLRDKEKREVDFIVTLDEKPWFSVEVKYSNPSITSPVKYFKEKLNIPFSFIVTKEEQPEYIKHGIKVISASKFLSGLI